MFLIRLISVACWVLAGMTLGLDLMPVFEGEGFAATPLGTWWFKLDPGSLNLLQSVTERYLFPELWDPGIITILQLPGWIVFGALALLLTIWSRISGRRRFLERSR